MKSWNQISRRQGAARTWILIVLISLLALAVPAGLYYVSTISFTNGTTGANLSAPQTGETPTANQAQQNPDVANTTAPRPAATDSPSTGKVMDLLVIDGETKQPLAEMRVQNTLPNHFAGFTDATGHVSVPVPLELQNSNYFAVRVGGKGYVPKKIAWASYDPQLRATETPASYTLPMERPTKIRGKIIDDAGQPVGGARILIQFTKQYPNPHEQVEVNSATMARPILSAADGTWSYPGAPVKSDQIALSVWDNDHVSEDRLDPQPFTPISSLYDGTATYVLNRGVKLSGTVVDSQGTPIAGASVARGEYPGLYFVVPPETTDSNGHFSFHYAPGQDVILTFKAKGCAPQTSRLTMGSQEQDLKIQLAKAHRLTGKVVDSEGRPVPNAQIYVQSSQNNQTLNVTLQTDDLGDFHWNDAPAEPVFVNISAPGARQMDSRTLTPDQSNIIKLGRVSKIRGAVVDAQTGQPIQKFKLVLGIQWPGQDGIRWQGGFDPGWQVHPGEFEVENSWNYPAVAVRVIAPGYLPTDSRAVQQDEGDATLDLKMKPGKDLIFTALNSDGTPAANAQAVMAMAGQQAQINNGQAMNFSAQTAAGDQNGKIDFPPATGAFKIAVVADSGYTEFDQNDLAKSDQIHLKPWGTIKGRMMIGSKPAADLLIDMNTMDGPVFDQDQPTIFKYWSAKTDANGNFEVDRVAPGKWQFGRRVPAMNNSWTSTPLGNVDVAPGQTVTANLGGTGRPVVGKIILPAQLSARSDWTYGYCQIITRNLAMGMRPPIPDSLRNSSPEEQRKWFQNWMKSDEGKKYLTAMRDRQRNMRSYPITIAADGTYRADDVPPGDYTININLSKTESNTMYGQRVGIGEAQFTMPEIPGGRSDDPLQIDPITVATMDKYKVGDEVFDLHLITSDGKNAKLSDFRGKYLLIEINARPFDLSAAKFKQLSQDYGKDSRLVMMSILPQLIESDGTPHRTNNNNPWIQASIPTSSMASWNILNTSFASAGGLGAWLIGPDQKVVAEDLVGDGIRNAVVSALGARQPVPDATATQPSTAP